MNSTTRESQISDNDRPRSFTARVAALFRSQPNRWIPASEIARVGGSCAWRTRISECRRGPYFMTITNRTRRVESDGRTFTVSEYRHVPAVGFEEEEDRRDVGVGVSPLLF
jgi:hypothetical protein